MTRPKQLKIGLALGSGSVRGLAHIGVIKVLEENNIPINFIAGSSIGAMIGGMYAVTKDIKKIEKIALAINWRQILSWVDPSFRQGMISGRKLEKFTEKYINKAKFRDLKIPFLAIATDLKTGEAVSMNKGEISSAIRASISLPLVFKPVKRENRLLADGGLSMPVPVRIVKKMGAEIVVAVDLDKYYYNENGGLGWYNIANNSLDIIRYHLAIRNSKEADIIIEPWLNKTHWTKILNGKDIILAGEKAAKKALPQLEKLKGAGYEPKSL